MTATSVTTSHKTGVEKITHNSTHTPTIMSRPYSQQDLKAEDDQDRLSWTRDEFEIPNAKACGGKVQGDAIYFCGNSLGLLSKRARQLMIEEVDVWSTRYGFSTHSRLQQVSVELTQLDSAVTGHFSHPHNRPWKHVDRPLTPTLAKLVGAKEDEVAHSSTLTSNLHNLFVSFYRPTKTKWKIVIEKGSFPSDWVGSFTIP